MAPEAVEHFCKVYAAERNRLASEANSGIEKLEVELVSIKAQQKRLVQAILAGVDASDVKDEMAGVKAQQSQLESALAAARRSEGPKVRFHPRMAEVYRDRVGALIKGLAGDSECIEVWEAVRGLIDKLVISPDLDDPDGKGSVVDVHGSLAALLSAATDAPLFRRPDLKRVATNGQTAANAALQDIDMIGELVLVAGARNRRNLLALFCLV